MENYLELWARLGRPSPERFHAALLKRGIVSPGVAWFRENVYSKDSKQIFAPPPKYKGHIYSPHPDERWAADIMVSTNKEWRYALVVQDIFSRYAWAEIIDSPMQAHEGMRAILRRARPPPQVLITDEDPGFKAAAFQDVLKDRRIIHEFRAGRNDLATVDRLIFSIKRVMGSNEAAGDARSLADIVAGINETGVPVLYGSAPEDLKDHNPALVFERMWDESQGMLDNARRIHARARRLQQEGAYRTLEQKGFRRRAGQAIWSRAVHRVGDLRGAFVDGRPTKEVLPTGGEEAAAAAPALNHRARELMLRYATRISDVISDTDDDVVSAQKVYAELVREAGSRRNLQNVLREAGVSAMAPVAAFVRVFPDFFRLEGNRVRFIGD